MPFLPFDFFIMTKNNRLLLVVFALLALFATSAWMYHLNERQQLWGYLPLVQFSSLWAVLVLVVYPKFSAMANKDRLMGYAILSGILLRLGFPTFPTTFLMFGAFIPLLLVEDAIAQSTKETAKAEVFRYSYLTFTLWNILATYWVGNTAFVAGLFAIFLSSAFMTIPFVLFHVVKKRMNEKMGYLAFVANWITFEYIYLNQEISWTWLNIGNAFAEWPSWVQWYEYTGVFGGALWILVANVIGFFWVRSYLKTNKIYLSEIVKWAAWVLVPIAFSLAMYANHEEKGKLVEVVVVQPNFEPHYVKFSLSHQERLQRFLGLSEKMLTDSTDYLVYPETAFNRIRTEQMLTDRSLRPIKNLVDKYPRLHLVTGISSQRIYRPGEPLGPAARETQRGNQTIHWESANAAIQLTSGSSNVDYYNKGKLVPGAEFLPYRQIFFFLKPLVDKLGGTLAGLATSDEREIFDADNGGKIAPIICYESVYGEYTTEYVHKGANAFFIVTNDGWWDDTDGHRQHLAFASLRAIENRRSIARSANTGISAFVNQRGDILQPTAYDEPIAIKGSIQLNEEKTIYTKWGDLIARVMCFLSIVLLLNGFVKGKVGGN